jgi:glucosamine 6-phosphate synthetase-like amidotransferase/phosphosugar isomerase protein
MGHIAKRVYAIDASPIWASTFIAILLKQKPKNVSFLFGSADEFVDQVKGDVALFCAHSDIQGLRLAAAQFAPIVIGV